MTTWRRVAIGAVALAAVAAAVLAFRPSGEGRRLAGAAPPIVGVDLEGRRVQLADFRGTPVLVNFWASWCVPCRKEFPLLREAHEDGVAVIGVIFQDERRSAAAFMREQQATWPAVVDPDGRIARAYDVGFRPGLPVTVAVDRRGILRDRHVGELRGEDLRRLVAAASRF